MQLLKVRSKISGYKTIALLNNNLLLNYHNKIYSNKLILTNERKIHIYEKHLSDYNKIIRGLRKTVLNPSEIIQDKNYDDTLYFIRKIKNGNQNVVVKINISNDDEHIHNSIISSWIISDSNLKRFYKKGNCIYKNEEI